MTHDETGVAFDSARLHAARVNVVRDIVNGLPRREGGKVAWGHTVRLAFRASANSTAPQLWALLWVFSLAVTVGMPFSAAFVADDLGQRLIALAVSVISGFVALLLTVALANRIGEEYREELDKRKREERQARRSGSA